MKDVIEIEKPKLSTYLKIVNGKSSFNIKFTITTRNLISVNMVINLFDVFQTWTGIPMIMETLTMV